MTQEAWSRWSVRFLAVVVLSNGLIALFRPLAERLSERLENFILLTNYENLTRSLEIFLGVTMIYLSYQLLQRRLSAWWLALAASIGLLALHFENSHWLIASLLPIASIVTLVSTKAYFRTKSEVNDIKRGLLGLAASIILALAYGTIGFWYMHQRDFGISFTIPRALATTFRAYTLIGNPSLVAHSRHARWFLSSLGFMGGFSLAYGLFSLFRPLEYYLIYAPRERTRAENLIRDHSRSSEDFFKLWPHDKTYFFATDHQAVLAYGVKAHVAYVVGDPVGEVGSIKTIIKEFENYCLISGWTPAYIYTSAKFLKDYRAADMSILKIGEDAMVNIPQFITETCRNKHFRNIANRFNKAGYSTALHQAPHSPSLLAEVAAISTAWMAQPGRREWRFIVGNFSEAYIQLSQLFILRDDAGLAQAFVNLIPSYAKGEVTIDLMRYRPDAPANIMDYLFLELLLTLSDYQYFNLGLAPLSGLDEGIGGPEERLLELIYESNQRFISLKGLRQFKAKFEPEWESKYVAYHGNPARLPRIAYGLSKIMPKD